MPFQKISQRIRRKHDIASVAKRFPVELNLFDVVFYEGQDLLDRPFRERREVLESALPEDSPLLIRKANQLVTDDVDTASEFYAESLQEGHEGIMMKNLEGLYKPGARVGYGAKVKPVMETLDVAIVGAEWGEGKRGDWLASFIIAVRDPDSDEIVEIGRVGTGFKEKEEEGLSFKEMTEMLKPDIVSKDGRTVKVKPKLVIEVAYEEIQESPTYSSGYALRFPRFVRLREDRGVEQASTTADVEYLYSSQRGRNQ